MAAPQHLMRQSFWGFYYIFGGLIDALGCGTDSVGGNASLLLLTSHSLGGILCGALFTHGIFEA